MRRGPSHCLETNRGPSHCLETNRAVYGISDVVRQIVSACCP